ncbi:MAG: vitamin B12 dependent-methionine synthase activation domain-containing protein [Litorivicinaceae bacterium]
MYGFWPAHSEGEDIVVFPKECCSDELVRFPMLRQQAVPHDGRQSTIAGLDGLDCCRPSADL